MKPNSSLLQCQFGTLVFNSPIVLLSGCVGFGDEYTRIEGFSNNDVGAICLKGTTLQPRLGNPLHRLAETPDGMLNAIGLQNPGIEALVNDLLPKLPCDDIHFIANVSGSTIDEYEAIVRRLNDTSIAAIEINVSCPNIKEGGLAFGNYPEISARVVEACRRATDKLLITKLSPNQTDIANNARQCLEAGSDAFAAINTITGMAIDIERRQPVLGNNQGGLSGPAIKPIALLKVWQVYQVCRAHHVPIIGQGGITNATDAIEFMLAGASAVGLGTGLFYDPLLCGKINQAIIDYLIEHNINCVSDLVGTLEMHDTDIDSFE